MEIIECDCLNCCNCLKITDDICRRECYNKMTDTKKFKIMCHSRDERLSNIK